MPSAPKKTEAITFPADGTAFAFLGGDKILSIVLLSAALQTAGGISCYNCQGVSRIADCNLTTACSHGEVCFQEKVAGNGGFTFNLGCRDKQLCQPNSMSVVGRRYLVNGFTNVENCTDCCGTEECNRGLCWNDSACIDTHTLNCSTVNSLLDICSEPEKAKLTCKRFCGLCDIIDGGLSLWSSWSNCDVTCGNGTQSRTRTCTNPAPQHGGKDCTGTRSDTKPCHKNKCAVPGGWSTWSPWGTCSVSCGPGVQRRGRTCSNPYPSTYGEWCRGDSREDQICTLTSCTVHGGWSNWSPWGECSVSCGPGIQSRDRTCSNPYPSSNGDWCHGDSRDDRICTQKGCIDGGWSTWQSWTHCSASCGNGFKTRTRECSSPVPSVYGKPCTGQPMDITFCVGVNCTDGGWSSWEAWSKCSVTCGYGFKSRSRGCTNPTPYYGQPCLGQSIDSMACSGDLCPSSISSFTVTQPATITNNYLTFTQVISNSGGDFNQTTGLFKCSKPGTYMFTFILVKKRANSRVDQVYCNLNRNGAVIIRGQVDPFDDDTDKGSAYAGNTAVIHLNKGDTVGLYGCSGPPSTYMESWTSFSGFLLYPDA